VIVKVAGWLYIVQAALALLSMVGLPYFGRGDQLQSSLLSLGVGAIGVGLLKQLTWARWLALGTSFIGWTLGALLLLGTIGLAIFVIAGARELLSASGGVAMIIGFVFLFVFAALAVGVVVNFKLFWHLISPEGKEEFAAPEGSSFATVVASCAVWICACVLTVGTSSASHLVSAALLQSMAPRNESPRDSRAADRVRAEREAQLQRARRDDARLAQQRQDERIRAAREAVSLEAERNASYDERIRAAEIAQRQRAAEALADDRTSQEAADKEKAEKANKILKCQDSSGAVSYTQGYCPPGSKEVARPTAE
jgi:hypothetical protein